MSKISAEPARRYFVSPIHIIIGIPPHIIVIGMPMAIMDIIFSQHIAIMSMVIPPSIGVIVQTMPVAVISAVILQGGIIIGMPIPMPPPIMGIPPIMFIGIIMGIMFIGIIPMGMFIGICIAGIIGEILSVAVKQGDLFHGGQEIIGTFPRRSNRQTGQI